MSVNLSEWQYVCRGEAYILLLLDSAHGTRYSDGIQEPHLRILKICLMWLGGARVNVITLKQAERHSEYTRVVVEGCGEQCDEQALP